MSPQDLSPVAGWPGCGGAHRRADRIRGNHAVREFLADRRRDQHTTIKDRLARGVTDDDLTMPPNGLDAIARYYATVVQGLLGQARDGATRAELEAVI